MPFERLFWHHGAADWAGFLLRFAFLAAGQFLSGCLAIRCEFLVSEVTKNKDNLFFFRNGWKLAFSIHPLFFVKEKPTKFPSICSCHQNPSCGSGSGSFRHPSKMLGKILISREFLITCYLIFEEKCKYSILYTYSRVVPGTYFISNTEKKYFCWYLESYWRKGQDPDLAP